MHEPDRRRRANTMEAIDQALHSLRQSGLVQRLNRQRRLRSLKQRIAASQPLKVVIGAGPTTFAGWIETERDLLNITSAEDWRRLFQPASIDRLLAEHVWEHLSPW